MPTVATAPLVITHPAHPGHALRLVATRGAMFHCDGCKQYGNDEHRYRCECEPCNFDLHVCCAPLTTHFTHPLFDGRTFVFLHQPPAVPGYCGRFCNACGETVHGFTLYDGANLDLHPRCASLPEHVVGEDGVLNLCRQAPTRGSCSLCRQGQDGQGRSSFWCYSYHNGGPEYMHVACIMEAQARHSHGQLTAPTIAGEVGTLQRAPIAMGTSGGFQGFYKMAMTIARITYVVATLDPMGIVMALADIQGSI